MAEIHKIGVLVSMKLPQLSAKVIRAEEGGRSEVRGRRSEVGVGRSGEDAERPTPNDEEMRNGEHGGTTAVSSHNFCPAPSGVLPEE